MKACLVAFSGLLLAAPAFAQPSGPAGGNDSTASSPGGAPESANHRADGARDTRQICRRIDSDMSRRIGSRLVCHTAAEWRQIQDAS
jgi:hypothetical protein